MSGGCEEGVQQRRVAANRAQSSLWCPTPQLTTGNTCKEGNEWFVLPGASYAQQSMLDTARAQCNRFTAVQGQSRGTSDLAVPPPTPLDPL